MISTKEAPCHTCILKDTCNILKMFQVIVHECLCLEYQEVKEVK